MCKKTVEIWNMFKYSANKEKSFANIEEEGNLSLENAKVMDKTTELDCTTLDDSNNVNQIVTGNKGKTFIDIQRENSHEQIFNRRVSTSVTKYEYQIML